MHVSLTFTCQYVFKPDIKHHFVRNGIPVVVEMALASGHWVEKETEGMAPSPRYGTLVFYLDTPNVTLYTERNI